MDRYIAQHGPDDGYHITVERSFIDGENFDITIWNRNHGLSNMGVSIRDEIKARAIAIYL